MLREERGQLFEQFIVPGHFRLQAQQGVTEGHLVHRGQVGRGLGVQAMPPGQFVGQPPEWGKQKHEEYEKEHYHGPSDEIQDSWNYDGMIEDAQLGFWVGLNIANAAQGPTWTPGDEFEAARKKE